MEIQFCLYLVGLFCFKFIDDQHLAMALNSKLSHAMKNICNVTPLRNGPPSVLGLIKYYTGDPCSDTIYDSLIKDGYCVYRNTGLKRYQDIINQSIPSKIFSGFLDDKSNFEQLKKHIVVDYQLGPDDRENLCEMDGKNNDKSGSYTLYDVSAGEPPDHYLLILCQN